MIILADDLTGANDTAVQYKNCGASSIVSVGMPDSESISRFAGYDVISVNTDSRAMPSAKAYDAVYEACRFFNKNGAAAPYKKIDSVLRGNPGTELEAVMDSFKSDFAFVCPAYPGNGRIVKNGILYAGDDKIDAVKTSVHTLHIEFIAVGKHCKRGGLRGEGLYVRAVVHEIRREGLEIYFILVFKDLPYFVVVECIVFELVFQRGIYQLVLGVALEIAEFFKRAYIYAQVRGATIGEYRTSNFFLGEVVQLPYLSVESKQSLVIGDI